MVAVEGLDLERRRIGPLKPPEEKRHRKGEGTALIAPVSTTRSSVVALQAATGR